MSLKIKFVIFLSIKKDNININRQFLLNIDLEDF